MKRIKFPGFGWCLAAAWVLWLVCAPHSQGSGTIPNEMKMPGTQPGEFNGYTNPNLCANCHGGTANPEFEPTHGWNGSMMAHSARDPLFWATLAVAEQDFLPGAVPATRGGAGDLCLRCHMSNGWLNGRSVPTDGSAMSVNADKNGIECELCHLLTDPDQPLTVPGTVEEQTAPFLAYDTTSGEAYRGSGQYVINSNGTRLGPYANPNAKHPFIQSTFHRKSELCATCHDVSNPAVGDMAHNNGAQIPLLPGTFSGVLGGPITDKAAFNNPPASYGVVERTYSEWKSSAWASGLLVNDFPTLPADLQTPGGILDVAYHRAHDARSNANYEDGEARYFTCQTCHMSASTGEGCNKVNTPIRTDLPRHDLTGAGYWMPGVIQYMDTKGTLRFGTGLTADQISGMNDGMVRATFMLQSAIDLNASQNGNNLDVKITNLTGHKFITGYPEGRRVWLNVRWFDGADALIQEDGGYGPIGRIATDIDGVDHQVESILDLDNTMIIEAEGGMDQQWAVQLLSLGYSLNHVISYDRLTDAVDHTLEDLSLELPGTGYHSFHFVLNNTMLHDNRIPPYGFQYDEARVRNALPVPATQFGDPGAGGIYDYWMDTNAVIPSGAVRAELRIFYQQTSWEYIQFLWLQNDGLSPFLGNEGVYLLDAWLNNNMSPPLEMAFAEVTGISPAPPGEASGAALTDMTALWDIANTEIDITYTAGCNATESMVYWGPLSQVASYSYGDVTCGLDTSGAVSFDASGDLFFVIVSGDGSDEGSYGLTSASAERPEAGVLGVCIDTPQNLVGTCN